MGLSPTYTINYRQLRKSGNGRGGLPHGVHTSWFSSAKGSVLKTYMQV